MAREMSLIFSCFSPGRESFDLFIPSSILPQITLSRAISCGRLARTTTPTVPLSTCGRNKSSGSVITAMSVCRWSSCLRQVNSPRRSLADPIAVTGSTANSSPLSCMHDKPLSTNLHSSSASANGGFIRTLVGLAGTSRANPSPSRMLLLPSPLKIILTIARVATSESCSMPYRLPCLKLFISPPVLLTRSRPATRKPPVPQAGSNTTSFISTLTTSAAKLVICRGVRTIPTSFASFAYVRNCS